MKKTLDLTPVNPNASAQAKRLMQFLGENYGRHILSGQMDLTWDDRVNMIDRVEKATGFKPALMGYDLMNYNPNENKGHGKTQIEKALAYAAQGGLITFCWHWRMGAESQFYTEKTKFRIHQNPPSEEYQSILSNIDRAAQLLSPLKEAGIPILWRPLHEAAGGWFWWGASGPEDYLFLWNLLFQRMTEVHGLDNLIWVWNGQDPLWYPGDDRVDIIGMDIYEGQGNHSSFADQFALAQSSCKGALQKMLALTENGSIPDPENLIKDGVPWSWFMTWNDGNRNDPEDFFSGDLWTSHEKKKAFFNHPYVLNLGDLPDLYN